MDRADRIKACNERTAHNGWGVFAGKYNLTPQQAKDFLERTVQSFAEVAKHKDVYPRGEVDIPTIDGLRYKVNL
ncbi:MAG: hypothetical protein NC350_03875 [Corallococcus sp.]|nr:hypothetical protein [Corallococcus sp.]